MTLDELYFELDESGFDLLVTLFRKYAFSPDEVFEHLTDCSIIKPATLSRVSDLDWLHLILVRNQLSGAINAIAMPEVTDRLVDYVLNLEKLT